MYRTISEPGDTVPTPTPNTLAAPSLPPSPDQFVRTLVRWLAEVALLASPGDLARSVPEAPAATAAPEETYRV